jgi:hypothetical protein
MLFVCIARGVIIDSSNSITMKKMNIPVLEITDNGIGNNMNRNRDKVFGLYKTCLNKVSVYSLQAS